MLINTVSICRILPLRKSHQHYIPNLKKCVGLNPEVIQIFGELDNDCIEYVLLELLTVQEMTKGFDLVATLCLLELSRCCVVASIRGQVCIAQPYVLVSASRICACFMTKRTEMALARAALQGGTTLELVVHLHIVR